MQVDYLTIANTVDLTERRVPMVTLRAAREGAVVWLVANAHGDEVTGVEVCHRVLEHVRERGLAAGTLHMIPMMNPLAYELMQRHLPYDDDDLNRHYPGRADGGPTERLAHLLYQRIAGTLPDVVIDLHAITTNSLPFVILDRLVERQDAALEARLYELARAFGVTVTYDYRMTQYRAQKLDSSLPGALVNHAGIAAFTVELGARGFVAPAFAEAGYRGVLNVLRALGLLPPGERWTHPTRLDAPYPLRRDPNVSVNAAGFVQQLTVPGEEVRAGQPVARVKNALGDVLETVCAPLDGWVLALSDRAVAFPGTRIMTLAVRDA